MARLNFLGPATSNPSLNLKVAGISILGPILPSGLKGKRVLVLRAFKGWARRGRDLLKGQD